MMNKTTYYTLGWGSVFAPTGEDYATKTEAIQEAKRLAANGVKDIAVYRITRTSKESEANMTVSTTTKTDKIIIIA